MTDHSVVFYTKFKNKDDQEYPSPTIKKTDHNNTMNNTNQSLIKNNNNN